MGKGLIMLVYIGQFRYYIANTEDADQIDMWFRGMTAATSLQINTAVATRAR